MPSDHTTVRLSDAGKARLRRLAEAHGGQTAAIETALEVLDDPMLAMDRALDEFEAFLRLARARNQLYQEEARRIFHRLDVLSEQLEIAEIEAPDAPTEDATSGGKEKRNEHQGEDPRRNRALGGQARRAD